MEIAVLIHKDEGSVYGVTVPALPGCFSWGETMDEALGNTNEAVLAHLSMMISEGMPIRLAQSPIQDSSAEGGVWATVDVDISGFDR